MQKEITLSFPLLPCEMAAPEMLQPEQSPSASEGCHHPVRGDLALPHFLLSPGLMDPYGSQGAPCTATGISLLAVS